MAAFKVPNQILQYLTCQNCTNFLSCGPVTVVSNGRSLCGRCRSTESYCIRSELYVEVARYFKFPCMYWKDHCPEVLKWENVQKHEKSCKFANKCSAFFASPSSVFKARNTMDFKDGLRCTEIPEALLNKLSCSDCHYYLSCPPLYVNQDNKQICHRCYENKDLGPFVRHVALETLLQLLVFPCVYRSSGCPTRERFGEGCYSHELECSYGQSYKKLPFTKSTTTTVMTKDGKLKERGLVESHRGPVWATITPTSIPFGQGKYKLTSQPTYNENNHHMDYSKQQLVLDPSGLKKINKNSYIGYEGNDYDGASESGESLDERIRKRSEKSDKSVSSHPAGVHRQYSDMSQSTNEENLQRPTSDQQYYENLQDMYLNGHPGVLKATLNRTGSFLESSIQPTKPLRYRESAAGDQYDGMLAELKIRQKIKDRH